MSVNDVFVLRAWAEASDAQSIVMLADGNADLTRALGIEVDRCQAGLGIRCKRFAMIIEEGLVTHFYVEADGELSLSSADNILEILSPVDKTMSVK